MTKPLVALLNSIKVPYPISKVPYRGGGALGTQVCIGLVHRSLRKRHRVSAARHLLLRQSKDF